MTVTVTSPATHKAFTTLTAIKAELGITASTDDNMLVQMILEATDYIIGYCGRTFAREAVTETFDAFGGSMAMLTITPVIAVSAVTLDGSTVSSTSYSIDDANAGFLFRETGWTTTHISASHVENVILSQGRRDWSVSYSAGYIMPGSTAGQRTLPYDLERACLDLVKQFYFRRGEDPTVKNQRTGETSETLFEDVGRYGISPNVRNTLDRWRRLSI